MSGILVGVGASLLGGLFGSSGAKKRARAAAREKAAKERELNRLEATRQAVINPYENVKDLSGTLSNSFANLSVATQAAEIQMEQTDIALANTLDTLRATGASAGGATALAQAALESKRNVAAGIEQQEAKNEQLKASGEQSLQQQKLAEAQRVQQLEAAGKEFTFRVTEDREMAKINRVAGQMQQAAQQEAQAKADQSAAWAGAFTGAIGAVAGGVTSGAFKDGGSWLNPASTGGFTAPPINNTTWTPPPFDPSDIRLKENIVLIGSSNSGINIYEYNYISDPETRYVGVIAQELLDTQFKEAVVIAENGYYAVDYNKIDVKFKKIKIKK